MNRFRLRPSLPDFGFALAPALVFTAVGTLMIGGLVSLSSFEYNRQSNRADWEKAYQVAENGLLEGVQRVSEANKSSEVSAIYGTYTSAAMPFTLDSNVKQFAFTIAADPSGTPDFHVVKCTATVGKRTRTLQATVQYRPSSKVFDYTYFLNNWGWYWGSSITAAGDIRSNWNFDFKNSPTVNGHIYASGSIQNNGVNIDPQAGTMPVSGWARSLPTNYAHQGVRRLTMPNLKDINYYKDIADGTIKQNNVTLVDKVHVATDKPGYYLDGSVTPIVIDGTVVIPGDCIIKGKISGTGSLIVGGNLYIAGNVTYNNAPTYSSPPSSANTPALRQQYYDSWVDTTMAANKDLVAFGAIGQVLVGDVTNSTWKSNCYSNTSYGLQYLGREDNLGADGIRGTADDGVDYLDTDGDGTLDYGAYDADGNGTIRSTNYDYTNEINMTDSRMSKITGYPQTAKIVNRVTTYVNNAYNTIASSSISSLYGVYYTNHAMAMYSTSSTGFKLYGTMVCRDEAMIFSGSLTNFYDWRIHSRYRNKYFDGNGNKIINLELPQSMSAAIIIRSELKPTWPLS